MNWKTLKTLLQFMLNAMCFFEFFITIADPIRAPLDLISAASRALSNGFDLPRKPGNPGVPGYSASQLIAEP